MDKIIKIKNQRKDGSLYHYAHFICDCLFPEIINEIYNYSEVIREKNLSQTLGNFNKIYTEVMQIKNTEINKNNYDSIKLNKITYPNKESYCNKFYIF